ncbi:MAG: class I SAM-dependent methyltransferase [Desmonostoc vinosum HA7617-LM4]|jgi:SAM-dependent methyltransferase|nr:class I SAM-dependent methyltransferase [Desmonostoc vinosum HA7617-LM4]
MPNFLKKLIGKSRKISTSSTKEQVDKQKPENFTEPSVTEPFQWIQSEALFSRRVYIDYEEYIEHQRSKLGKINLTTYDRNYRAALGERLLALHMFQRGDNVLCLAARIGTECKAFIDLGCFAIGIDLNPGENNPYVVYGDFHHLQFADASVDYVFTNSLDHVFDLDQVISEIFRVLKPGGVFIAEIVAGTQDEHGREPGEYESFWWEKLENVVDKIVAHGFVIERKERFAYPWGGDQIIFRKSS